MQGCVFDIQRFSIHDGPGIRTTVFLKGCPLRCRWCCNPESMRPEPVLLFNRALCIGCGKCAEVCPTGAAENCLVDRALCIGCGKCAEVCYAGARYMKGESKSSEAIVAEALKDRSFYERTGGGITFSGGEPLLQVDFLHETLKLCRAHGLHTAIETCGSVPWPHFERIVEDVDIFLFDVKSTDGEKHLRYTGGRCEPILENCARLAKAAKKVIVRVPVVPEFNFDLESLTTIVRFAEKIGIGEVHFLPYHRYAASKYTFLDQEYWHPGVERLGEDEVRQLVGRIETGIKLQIGG